MSGRLEAGKASPLVRGLLISLGTLSLIAGIIGLVVPVWPTTCFLLAALSCFSKSSTRMQMWMFTNRYFGKHLRCYKETGQVHPRVKTMSLVSLWVSLPFSLLLIGGNLWLSGLVLLVAAATTLHVLKLPSVHAVPGACS